MEFITLVLCRSGHPEAHGAYLQGVREFGVGVTSPRRDPLVAVVLDDYIRNFLMHMLTKHRI